MTATTAPIAWMVYTLDGKSAFVTDNPADFTQDHQALPLYTTPPQRKPLTVEEIIKIWNDMGNDPIAPSVFSFIACVRKTEQAHGIA